MSVGSPVPGNVLQHGVTLKLPNNTKGKGCLLLTDSWVTCPLLQREPGLGPQAHLVPVPLPSPSRAWAAGRWTRVSTGANCHLALAVLDDLVRESSYCLLKETENWGDGSDEREKWRRQGRNSQAGSMGGYKWVVMGKNHGRAAGLRLDSLKGPGIVAKRWAGRVVGPSQW